MAEVFGSNYSGLYDALYSDKDYAAECDIIERILKEYGQGRAGTLLDLGCGTGNHAFPLAKRGYRVTGVDRSEEMLNQLKKKLAYLPDHNRVSLHHDDIRSIDLPGQFDAAMMMFAVLGYQYENNDVLSTLKATRHHLHPSGLLIFDIWYGPAVLHQGPTERVKTIPTAEGRIVRFSSGELDVRRHLCKVHFRICRFEGQELAAETKETHQMRYFFPKEIELFLELASFSLLRLSAFPEVDKEPDEERWNVLGIARAV